MAQKQNNDNDNDKYPSSQNNNCGNNQQLSYVSLLKNVGPDSTFAVDGLGVPIVNWRVIASSSKKNKNTGFDTKNGVYTAQAAGNYSVQFIVSYTLSSGTPDINFQDFIGFYLIKNPAVPVVAPVSLKHAIRSAPLPGPLRTTATPPVEYYLGIGQVSITSIVALDRNDTLVFVYDSTGLDLFPAPPIGSEPTINIAPVSQLIPALSKQSIATSLTIKQLKQW
jgi:hypothetical protein